MSTIVFTKGTYMIIKFALNDFLGIIDLVLVRKISKKIDPFLTSRYGHLRIAWTFNVNKILNTYYFNPLLRNLAKWSDTL